MLKLIDALVVPRLRKNDALLGEWQSARRVARKPGPVATGVSVAAGTSLVAPTV